jgi:hypothetical protein
MMREAEALTFQDDFENSIDSMTTAGGMRVDTITSCKDKHVQSAVTVTRANGQSISFEADDNVRINEREDGALAITFAKTGEIRVYATDGSMNVEQGEPLELGRQWEGTDGDDVFLSLRTGTQINAKAGNDSILLLTNTRSVKGGDGDDLIVAGSAIDTFGSFGLYGDGGNDTLYGANVTFDFIDMGDGDNEITVNGVRHQAKVGNGDNIVTINNAGSSTIIAGNGNNSVKVDKLQYGQMIFGDGDNNILINSFMGFDFRVGNGNNAITVGEFLDSPLKTGDGDNTVTVGNFQGSFLDTGNGDNEFTLRYIRYWRPYSV